MIEHLRSVSREISAGKHAVILMDRATWHTSPKITNFKNITIVPLPSASPELNPTEQVWAHLRQRSLANRCFDSYENICDAACDAVNQFAADPISIQSLCSRKWMNLTC
jgi:transposase